MDGSGWDAEHELILDLINRSQEVICAFVDCLANNPTKAWEAVVELRELIRQMQLILPPKAFVDTSHPLFTIEVNQPAYKIFRSPNK